MKIDHPSDCPLCHGIGWRPTGNPEHPESCFTRCDHTYVSYNGKVIATGNAATFLFGALMAAPILIILAAIAVFTS